jgi:hypothetical protein
MVVPYFILFCDSHSISSDLWVSGDVPGTQDTGKSADVSYAIGEAKGVHILYTSFLDL